MSIAHDTSRERIHRLHEWYRANVLDIPLTPEVERRWLTFFQQGFDGKMLARVVRWLRIQIASGKRNAGSLKLSCLLQWSEDGSLMQFAEDHALAKASFGDRLNPERRLSALPEAEAPTRPNAIPNHQPPTTPASDPAAAAAALAGLRRFRETLQ